MGTKPARGTTAKTSNIEQLVDLLMLNLIHEALNSGIKIARVRLAVSLEGQLGLCKGRVHDAVQEMADASAGVTGNMISLPRANMD